ncbi:TPM domain-containing protein [Leptospira kirschneri]|uniref:TPM domain-containing protein n=1 Tax=Leptospira kirschneri TaxID=29507 RepID=UPI0002784C25|nr:TPM domain-containing protein [Leptospira kirschneri]EJO71352.1 PF04536 family protein [Leptospira kirschneri serovar Grippotyphosa str. RM52]EKQ82195.1 PF04536 family protein [Leptospira kirschneri serovar Grippotyphosa str. Moskva]EMK07422.1 PF04536 family protein [Leptospira kirschneri str. MMD1493]EMN26999.1 PF04536 family protein [Leptospira kirschneri serovar Sokoine str. RM1]EPG49445.1 PF04536 family protein [Leptospira kirschneri serovar Cynopteri str. 3522 CT]
MINQYTNKKAAILRIWNHTLESFLFFFHFSQDKSKSYRFKKYFSTEDLEKIESEVSKSEVLHKGEIKVILELNLPVSRIIQGLTAKQRAEELFSQKRIWDTEENTGILIYIQLIDRKIELLADRGIYKKIGQNTLDEICKEMQNGFRSEHYLKSILFAIEEFSSLLQKYFPSGKQNSNELPDKPEVI